MISGQLWDKVTLLHINDLPMWKNALSNFDCGEDEVNNWLRNNVLNATYNWNSGVYLAVDLQQNIIGYFTICSTSLRLAICDDETKKKHHYTGKSIPALLLGQLGIDLRYRGENLKNFPGNIPQGPLLLEEAISVAESLAVQTGSLALSVDAINYDIIPWYVKHGFTSLTKKPKKLLYPLMESK